MKRKIASGRSQKSTSGLKPKKKLVEKEMAIFKNTGYRTTATGIQWSILTRRSPTNEARGGQTSD